MSMGPNNDSYQAGRHEMTGLIQLFLTQTSVSLAMCHSPEKVKRLFNFIIFSEFKLNWLQTFILMSHSLPLYRPFQAIVHKKLESSSGFEFGSLRRETITLATRPPRLNTFLIDGTI